MIRKKWAKQSHFFNIEKRWKRISWKEKRREKGQNILKCKLVWLKPIGPRDRRRTMGLLYCFAWTSLSLLVFKSRHTHANQIRRCIDYANMLLSLSFPRRWFYYRLHKRAMPFHSVLNAKFDSFSFLFLPLSISIVGWLMHIASTQIRLHELQTRLFKSAAVLKRSNCCIHFI